jgi:peptidoglycan hydrolase-like protein with peptidoglycan-binding domain
MLPQDSADPPVPPGEGTGLKRWAAPADAAEEFAAYVPQTSCDPRWRTGVRDFRDLVLQRYPATGDLGALRNCTDDGVSEHLDGRAWDWRADVDSPKQYSAATDMVNWLTAPGPDGRDAYWARRLGIMYIIYNRRIWGSYRAGQGWREHDGDPHTDHVHFSFSWPGATGRTSFWDGTVAVQDYGPCRPLRGEPAPLHDPSAPSTQRCPPPPGVDGGSVPPLWRGSRSPQVLAVQRGLGVPGANGFFGPATSRAVAGYQRRTGLPVTGAVDTLTRRSLVADGVLVR